MGKTENQDPKRLQCYLIVTAASLQHAQNRRAHPSARVASDSRYSNATDPCGFSHTLQHHKVSANFPWDFRFKLAQFEQREMTTLYSVPNCSKLQDTNLRTAAAIFNTHLKFPEGEPVRQITTPLQVAIPPNLPS